jgi:hypothetical protein
MLHFQNLPWLLLCKFQSSWSGSPPSNFPSHSSHRQRQSVYRAFFYCLSKSPVNEPSHPYIFPKMET